MSDDREDEGSDADQERASDPDVPDWEDIASDAEGEPAEAENEDTKGEPTEGTPVEERDESPDETGGPIDGEGLGVGDDLEEEAETPESPEETIAPSGQPDPDEDDAGADAHSGTGAELGESSPFDEIAASTDADDDLFEEAFDDLSADVDTEALWEELEGFEVGGAGTAREAVEVVPKRSFCEQCEHLSEPPEFRCTHEGTDIVEFVDSDHVRVRECPIVAQRRQMESE